MPASLRRLKGPDSPAVSWRLSIVVSVVCGLAEIARPMETTLKVLIVRNRRTRAQRSCVKCTFRRAGPQEPVHGLTQPLLSRFPRAVALARKNPDLVASRSLWLVEGLVCGAHKALLVRRIGAAERHPERCSHAQKPILLAPDC